MLLLKAILIGSCQNAPGFCHGPNPITSVSVCVSDHLELTTGCLYSLSLGIVQIAM